MGNACRVTYKQDSISYNSWSEQKESVPGFGDNFPHTCGQHRQQLIDSQLCLQSFESTDQDNSLHVCTRDPNYT